MKPPSSSGGGFSGMPPSGGSSFGSGSPLGGLGGGLGSIFGSGAGTPIHRRGGCGGIVGLILLLIILFLVFRSCQGGGSLLPSIESSDPYQPAQDTGYTQPQSPTATRWPTAVPSNNSGTTWLVMLYQNADDNALERDIFIDLNEAEMIGSTDQVTIVSQFDRHRGGFSGDGDWHTTRRYLVTYDNDLNRIGSELIEDIGEVNMAMPKPWLILFPGPPVPTPR